MDKQNVEYIYNGILFSLRMEGNSDSCYDMDEPGGHFANRNKPVTERQILSDPTYMRGSRVVGSLETESRAAEERKQ